MVVGIRADSSKTLGTGHVNRCLIIAKLLKKKNIKSYFISKNIDKETVKQLKNKNITFHKIRNFKEDEINKDSELTIKYIKLKKITHLIVDNYNLNFKWKKKVSNICKLIVIDDFFFKKTYCDIYINYHDSKKIMDKKKNFFKKDCKKLLGPKFSIIKPFRYLKKKKKIIFVFMGGVDKNNYTYEIMKFLNHNIFSKYKKIIMIGKFNRNKNQLIRFARDLKNFSTIGDNYKNLYDFFAQSKLVISGAGLTMYEHISYGVNSIVIPQSSVQLKILKNHKNLNFVNSPAELKKNKIIKLINFFDRKKFLKKTKMFNKEGVSEIIKHII